MNKHQGPLNEQEAFSKKELISQLIIVSIMLICFEEFILWINIQEYGSLAAVLKDQDRLLAKVLLAIVRLIV